MISLDEALALYGANIRPLAVETLEVLAARGRVLAAPAHSAVDLPMFTQSAVDGYALRSEDAARAPFSLTLAGEVAAGDAAPHRVETGQALRIFTGGRLPEGADTVARQEIVERAGAVITIAQLLEPGVDTRHRGEELQIGAQIAPLGARIGAGLLAALAMAGVREVAVRQRPRIALIVSGDEVAPAGSALAPGQIFDANGPLMSAWLAERGYAAPDCIYVSDDPVLIRAALDAALAQADLVLTSGGVSVGDRDYIPGVAESLGVRRIFWKVAQKPGKPLWFGMRGGSALLAMPGNPAAVLVGLEVHAARILDLMESAREPAPRWRSGLLAEAQRGDSQREGLVRMRVIDAGAGVAQLHKLPRQDSHMLSNLVEADALAWVPRSIEALAAGTPVRWIPLRR